jgi:hypothetical protein
MGDYMDERFKKLSEEVEKLINQKTEEDLTREKLFF